MPCIHTHKLAAIHTEQMLRTVGVIRIFNNSLKAVAILEYRVLPHPLFCRRAWIRRFIDFATYKNLLVIPDLWLYIICVYFMDSSILVWWNVIKAMEVCPLYSVAAILLKIITKIYERNSYWAKDPYELKIYYQYDCSRLSQDCLKFGMRVGGRVKKNSRHS